MSLIVEINPVREYELLSEGVHAAVLADIIDLGLQPGFQGGPPKQKIQFVWLTDEADQKGYTKRAFARYTFSLHKKSSLTAALRQMKVAVPTTGKFNVESLLGRQQNLVIQHNPAADGSGKIFANIASYMAPNQKVAIPADFKRKEVVTTGETHQPARYPGADLQKVAPTFSGATSDDIPF